MKKFVLVLAYTRGKLTLQTQPLKELFFLSFRRMLTPSKSQLAIEKKLAVSSWQNTTSSIHPFNHSTT